ncbi:cyclin-T1-like isoform X2 [Halichondria panicea]|uniref:cyclin-T1-like isoform X2 n=1 Tax=Halichondria panicea TaxID=6063 RepID=UPI00312B8F6A
MMSRLASPPRHKMAESTSAAVAISRFEERMGNLKERWYFTKEELENSPSRINGVDPAKELSYRQQSANLIKDVGHRIGVNQLCIATAVVYMHRFFIVHSFKSFPRFTVATAALFLAAKVEEQPRKLEHVARVSHACQNRDSKPPDSHSDVCKKLMEEISCHELLLLQTLGFDVAVEHPHQHVVKGTQLVRVSKDLSQAAYFMSQNSLLLTTFCLQDPPTVVACVCIHLTCRWKGIEIPLSVDGKPWWQYIDKTVTLEQLNDRTGEFLEIYKLCPNKLQKIVTDSINRGQQVHGRERSLGESSTSHTSKSPFDKLKGPIPHSSKLQSTQHQKPHKSGAHVMPSSSGQPQKHSSHPGKHQPSSGHGQHTGATARHTPSTLNGSHPQQTTHNSTHDTKAPSRPSTATVARPPSKHHPSVLEEHQRHKSNSGVKHSSSGPVKHPHHSQHQAAPGNHLNASKPLDAVTKHRQLSAEHKHRPISNHDGRPHNPLKRPHPVDAHDVKRVKLEALSGGNHLPPLPVVDTNSILTLPPLPTQHMELPPLPPPLPSEPPPNFPLGLDFPPPPPPSN